MRKTFYKKKELTTHIILAKIINDNGAFKGFRYENGKWVEWRYILEELFEDRGFDDITEEEAKEIMKGLDSNDL